METIYKLQPDRTLDLRGFDDRGAAGALHAATATSFKVSGVFRDPADFCVLLLWDADNFFEHPRLKYLPDFDFGGMLLEFDASYSGPAPLDTVKFPTLDNTFLDCVRADGSTAKIPLFEQARLSGGTFAAANALLTIENANADTGDLLRAWYLNLAYEYVVTAKYAPIAWTALAVLGTPHYVRWQNAATGEQAVYRYNEGAADSNTDVAEHMVTAVNQGGGPIQAVLSTDLDAGAPANQIEVFVKAGYNGSYTITSSDGGGGTVKSNSAPDIAQDLADLINATNWNTTGPALAVRASTEGGGRVRFTAARYGTVNVAGRAVRLAGGMGFQGLAGTMRIGTRDYAIASVESAGALTLAEDAGASQGIAYLADRGGLDGNAITMYAQTGGSGKLRVDRAEMPFGGGTEGTWRVRLDFTALGIDQLRQAWLTFVPRLADGAAYTDTEWVAAFSGWSVTDPLGKRALKVAGPGSVRIEENDAWCEYAGASWTTLYSNWSAFQPADGFYSKGQVRRAHTEGDRVRVRYHCGAVHDVWIGTSLQTDRGAWGVTLDGDAETRLDTYLGQGAGLAPIPTRRRVRAGVAAGEHVVTLVVRAKHGASSGTFCYFDFLEAAIATDVPAALPARTNVSPAVDYDTDHGYKVPAARLMWWMDQLGFAGPLNVYVGVFWWNQRRRVGATLASLTLRFEGPWTAGDQVFVDIGTPDLSTVTAVGKTVFAGETGAAIARHFAYSINAIFTGVWAAAADDVLTVTVRSPAAAYVFGHRVRVVGGAGVVREAGNLTDNAVGTWEIDAEASPTINRGAREWLGDLLSECKTRNREVTLAYSMELLNPPEEWAARFPDMTPVKTATGFGVNVTTHCAFSTPVLEYQKRVFRETAGLQAAAGLPVVLQCGEFLWWFFRNAGTVGDPNVGMAYYDAETRAAAAAALGRELYRFATPDDDPGLHAADVAFLRERLMAHLAAIRTYVRAYYAAGETELLLAFDVNYPEVYGVYGLGGRLNFAVNVPAEFRGPGTAPFDRIKMEGLDFGAGSRDLEKAKRAARWPFAEGTWEKAKCRYLVAVFNGGCPRELEELQTAAEGIVYHFWANDHVHLFGWDAELPAGRGGADLE